MTGWRRRSASSSRLFSTLLPASREKGAPEVIQRAQHALQVSSRKLGAWRPRVHAQHEALADKGAEPAAAEAHAWEPTIDGDAYDRLLQHNATTSALADWVLTRENLSDGQQES